MREGAAPGGAGARALFALLAVLGAVVPFRLLAALARGAALLVWLLSPRLRRGLDRNARRLLGASASDGARRALGRAQTLAFARFAAEIAASGRRGARLEDLLARVEGVGNLERALAADRGLVAVTLHFGNYELAAAALAGRVPGPVAVIYRRDPSRLWERRRRRWRRAAGVGGIAIDASPYFAVEALARLRRRGAVLLALDQPEPRSGVLIPVLGARARVSMLPARIALAAAAPILPAIAARGRDGRFVLRLEEPLLPAGRDAEALTAHLARAFEERLRASPEDWLLVQPFWEE